MMQFKTVYEESAYTLKKLVRSFSEKRVALNNQLNTMTDKQKAKAYKTLEYYDNRIELMQGILRSKAK
jgi:cellulose biosynthesis protein BcsQ